MPGPHLPVRQVVWPALTAWALLWGWLRRAPSGISWHFTTDGTAWLFGPDGLHLYARHPELQIGPLTFVLMRPFASDNPLAAQLVLMLAGVLALWLLAPAGVNPLLGLLVLPAWSVLAVRWVHPDDVIAMVAAAAAVRFVASGRGVPAGVALGLAVAAKPWALGFWPILWVLRGRRALGASAAAGIVTALAWAPFLLADPATLGALHPPVRMADTSVLWLLGIHGDGGIVPAWTRTVQLLAAPAVAAVVVGRGRWRAALVAALAVRLALDPQDIGYYEGTIVLAAAITGSPWFTAVTAALWWHPFVTDYARRFEVADGLALWWFRHPTWVAAAHLAWCVAVVGVTTLSRHDDVTPARPLDR